MCRYHDDPWTQAPTTSGAGEGSEAVGRGSMKPKMASSGLRVQSTPEGPGTLLLRNKGLKTMIIVAFGPNNWVFGPSGYLTIGYLGFL